MSKKLFALVDEFLSKKSDPQAFVDTFMRAWKTERDNGTALDDHPRLSEALSSVFAMADMYNPEADRASYEFDEARLRREIAALRQRLAPLP